jgi:8-oxo-dGTP pyrophosphatase MutT (NUDIX family)
MAKDRYQVSLKCMLRDREGRVLFLYAKKGGNDYGYYDLPGGRIEDYELNVPLEGILRREIKEEIGDVDIEVDMHPRSLLRAGIGPDMATHIFYVVFEGKYLGGEIKTSDEHEEGFVWEKPETLDFEKHIPPQHRDDLRHYLLNED